jgi:hypothetical protein
MKEINPLEAQLRSWTPRRPSPKIERRLFRWDQPFHFPVPKLVTVLAPAAACLLLTLAGWRQFDPPLLAAGSEHQAMAALSLSNQSFAPYLPGNGQSAANRLDTFEWTNRGCSQSSVRSFTPTKATDLP